MSTERRTPDGEPKPIGEIADALGLKPHELEPWGYFKGKLVLGRLRPRPQRGKYVAVTAVTPTPLGEGKTVTAIGLSMALWRLQHSALLTLREPSLAPVFGIKGGGAGGGRARLLPFEDINLHFTGDLHAVAAANNLCAAMLDNHAGRRRQPEIEPHEISWRRVLDVEDRGLSRIISGLANPRLSPTRETGFDLTAASELMAVLGLSRDHADLKQRLARLVLGFGVDGRPLTAAHIGAAGALSALLADALRPNLVQTGEHTPALVHTGPFANIAFGNSSLIADQLGLSLADYVVTEAGFGSDVGAEKLVHIKCRAGDLKPNVMVLVCTCRALKLHSGRYRLGAGRQLPAELLAADCASLRAGAENLRAHLEILQSFGVPAVVAVNRFPEDSAEELTLVSELAREYGATEVAVSDAFAQGSAGALELAEAVVRASSQPAALNMLYGLEESIEAKLETLATRVYGAAGVELSSKAKQDAKRLSELGYDKLPLCVAKTQYSLSHDPQLLGRPRGYTFAIRELRLAAGAGYVYALTGEISTMPGLPSDPRALQIDTDASGQIRGLS